MRNRAKCKLCKNVIESFHIYDYVTCKCGEISISGGNDKFECSAKDWSNFLRVDDKDNEIMVKAIDDKDGKTVEVIEREDIVKMIEDMRNSYERLPEHAKSMPINHYDFISLLLLIESFVKNK